LPQRNPPAGHHKRRHPPIGTTFSLTLDQPAIVSFGFARSARGRRVHGKCVRVTKHDRRKPRCTRTVSVATLRVSAPAGRDTLSFQGPVTRSRRLHPGHYRVTITASNSAGQRSAATTLSFTVLS
jgi:hypothetical protein